MSSYVHKKQLRYYSRYFVFSEKKNNLKFNGISLKRNKNKQTIKNTAFETSPALKAVNQVAQ